jgi:hypothetical protein
MSCFNLPLTRGFFPVLTRKQARRDLLISLAYSLCRGHRRFMLGRVDLPLGTIGHLTTPLTLNKQPDRPVG